MARYSAEQVEKDSVRAIAGMMVVAARTAPKSQGIDALDALIVDGEEIESLARILEEMATENRDHPKSFLAASRFIRKSVCVVLIGIMGWRYDWEGDHNCGACGFGNCANFRKVARRMGDGFVGPMCISKSVDLGIAVGSAVKTAGILNADNRIHYTIGIAAKRLNLLKSDVIYGIPLSATGKNIYFDLKVPPPQQPSTTT